MTQNKSDSLNFVYELYGKMLKDNLGYIYCGDFNSTLTDNILSLAESNLASIGESTKIKKRVYFLMVESLQNITRHQDKSTNQLGINSGVFIIQRIDKDYYITTGNLTDNKNVEPLRQKLEKVNSLDPENLKEYYKKILFEGDISDKGGAGLGLVEMARKSGNKLAFDFKKVSDSHSYFYLQTKIPTHEMPGGASGNFHGNLDAAVAFHQKIAALNLQLVYQGDFSHENVKNVLSMTEGNIDSGNELLIKKRVFNIMVEMLQNIHYYADTQSQGTDAKQGIFMIGKENGHYTLSTGNLMEKSKFEMIKKRLDHVNSLSDSMLEEQFNKIITSEEESEKGGAGLGFIDLRLKSRSKLTYDFHSIDDRNYFFSLKVIVTTT